MRKSKILGIALAAAMVSSIAATAAFSANAAATVSGTTGIKGGTVGITGSFCNWGEGGEKDVPMTDDDNDGIWEGTIVIDSVTQEMLSPAMTDPGDEHPVPRTDISGPAVQFKVRTDNDWTNSWGDYEIGYNRTWNSQTNCAVVGEVGKPLTIKVKLDTTTFVDQSQFEEEDQWKGAEVYNVWPVSYEVVAAEEPSSEEPKSEEPKSEEPTSEKPAEEPSEDDTPVETGDAASAAALVAVVLASLGTAVVMTKKASAKD